MGSREEPTIAMLLSGLGVKLVPDGLSFYSQIKAFLNPPVEKLLFAVDGDWLYSGPWLTKIQRIRDSRTLSPKWNVCHTNSSKGSRIFVEGGGVMKEAVDDYKEMTTSEISVCIWTHCIWDDMHKACANSKTDQSRAWKGELGVRQEIPPLVMKLLIIVSFWESESQLCPRV